jgi:hypothetical protein
MPVQSPHTSEQHQALYTATVKDAAARGAVLMGKLVSSARDTLQNREAKSRDLRERDSLAESVKQLRKWESALCKHYPQALLDAFERPPAAKKGAGPAVADLEFDQLELMDEVQVLTSVALARIQQVAVLSAEGALADLNTLICSTLGLGTVHPERNPLRPEVYISALKEVVEHTQLPPSTQLDWLGAMSVALGQELRDMYLQLASKLRGQGVVSANYAVLQTPTGPGIGRGIAQQITDQPMVSTQLAGPEGAPAVVAGAPAAYAPQIPALQATHFTSQPAARSKDEVLLTLDKLRQLLTGELDAPPERSVLEAFAARFAREFEGNGVPQEPAPSEFDATVPAALEALNEMQQVDQMVQRLQSRRGNGQAATAPSGDSVQSVRGLMRARAKGVAHALSLEVVTLMVENIARDIRLLEPVQQLVRSLEPPLLRLALVDPRLFSNKNHPARLLVQEITHRSLAYATVQSSGFGEFMYGVEQGIAPLMADAIQSAEPFERALEKLREGWMRVESKGEQVRKEAVQVLQHAEQRNLLAEKIAREIDAHPDASRVPEVVLDFLCGPWAQVVAQARIVGGAASPVAGKYQSLISALMWSTHPTLTQKNYTKLTRLVPRLLVTLREGLESIRYPGTKTSAFFEALMGLHQKAFRTAQRPPETVPEDTPAPQAVVHQRLVEAGDPWIAPEEAKTSNFMELADLPQPPAKPGVAVESAAQGVAAAAKPLESPSSVLETVANVPLGSWVEMMINGQWIRTQLTWASPHGTLFLFTSVFGTSQSMTRRSRDKMVEAGNLRVISGQPMVEGALNAVAQQAMRNSVDSTLE